MSPASPSSDGTSTDVRKILGRLGRLRARIRAIFATIGVSRWIVFALGVLALFFLADWLLDLPLSVRRFTRLGLLQPPSSANLLILVPALAICGFLAIAFTRRGHRAAPLFSFLTAGCVGLFVWMAVRAFVPMRARLSDDDLALSVESRFAHLQDRLAAALDFDDELRQPTRGESPAMMQAVVHEAAEEVRSLRFSKAVSGQRALRWAGGALAAVLVAVGATSVFADEIGLWARRSLLLEDIAWPRATAMVAVDLQADGSFAAHAPESPYEVPIGRSLTVYARAVGKTPDSAQVLDIVPGQSPLARRMFTVPGHPEVFAYEFLDVRRPFAFVVHGGDDEDEIPRYRVEITIPPRVLSMQSTITYPEYLGRAGETLADGSVTVPQGASVAVEFTTDMPIAKAHAVLGDVAVPAEAVGTDGMRFRFSYEAERSVSGRLVLRTPAGKENDPASDSFDVRVKIDQPPRIDWIWPRGSVEVSPTGRVPLIVQSHDDHGVAELRLEVRINGGAPTPVALRAYTADAQESGPVPTSVNDSSYGRQRLLTYVPVEIAALRKPAEALEGTPEGEPTPLQARDAVSFRLTATDSRGQVRESEWMRADIGSPAALERGLHTQRSNVRLSIEAVEREQRTRRDDIKAVLGTDLGAAELDLIKTVRFSQGKIAQDADRAVQTLIGIFNEFVYDRLGAESPNAKILGYLGRHHRTTYGLPADPSSEPAVRPAARRSDWKGDAVFPYALYDEIVAAWRGKVIFDKGLLDKMLGALADAIEVGARAAPRAHQAAADALAGDRKAVETLLTAQEHNLASIKALLAAMAGWQSLHEMKLLLRGIIDEQKVVIREQDEADKKAAADKKAESKQSKDSDNSK